jgi:DNA-binding NtrC family response regulator
VIPATLSKCGHYLRVQPQTAFGASLSFADHGLTAHATAAKTIDAMRLGAFDHLTKPIGRKELSRVLAGMLAAGAEPGAFRPEPEPDGLIGSGESMRTVQKTIGTLADSNATVLISGETGTGKEMVARAIHDHGRRGGKPFIPVNCAAIPAELMESKLFGHVRGAFTRQRPEGRLPRSRA